MLPAALEYPSGDWNGFRVYRPARGGRSWDNFGGYKTINRMPLPLYNSDITNIHTFRAEMMQTQIYDTFKFA